MVNFISLLPRDEWRGVACGSPPSASSLFPREALIRTTPLTSSVAQEAVYLDMAVGLWTRCLSPLLTTTISTFLPPSPARFSLPLSPTILLLLNLATSLHAALSSSSSDELLSSLGRPSRSCSHMIRSCDIT